MYEAFFGLRERPFDLTPNPRFLLLTTTHREALANLQYGVTGRKGLTLLVGEAGLGKTTLLRTALDGWQADGHLVAYLNNPTLTRDEFLEYLTAAFALTPAAAESKARFLAELTDVVRSRHLTGQITALVVDEAQSLSNELLEEIRLLINIETADEKMFQVVLAGQPELAARLQSSELRQLKQRVALRCAVMPLDMQEAAGYIAGRIHVAGGVAGQIFTREAVMAVHAHAQGVPRIISVICDNTLLAGFAAGRRPVTRDLVDEVCRDFDIARDPGDAGAAPDPPAAPPRPEPAVALPEAPTIEAPALAATGTTGSPEGPVPGASPARDLFDQYAAKPRRRFSFF